MIRGWRTTVDKFALVAGIAAGTHAGQSKQRPKTENVPPEEGTQLAIGDLSRATIGSARQVAHAYQTGFRDFVDTDVGARAIR